MMRVQIVIIGAGAAGIAAATKLHENGFTDYLILEASDRIGGRIWTVPFGQNVIDLGAQWCHGKRNNVVYKLAGHLDLLEDSMFSKNHVLLLSNGRQTSVDVTERMMEIAENIMNGEAIMSAKAVLGDYFTDNFKRLVKEQEDLNEIDYSLVEKFIAFYHKYLKGYLAIDSWYDLSTSEILDYEECEGPLRQSWRGNGSETVLKLLKRQHPSQKCEAIPVNDRILFNKKVQSICYTTGSNVSIKCDDDSDFNAQFVIVTIPLGVLKHSYESLFNPPLPKLNVNAIKGLHFGTVNKAFLEFSVPFWKDKGNVFRLLWCDSDLKDLQSSKYSWTEGVSTFSCIDDYPNVLSSWIVGLEGRQSEALPDDEFQEGLLMLLKKFFVGIDIPKPLRFMRSTWNSDTNFRGSYSSRSLNTTRLNTGAMDLSIPVLDCHNKPVIMFAGEATSPTHWSTVHGAVETGWREADRLIQWHQGNI